MLTCDCFKTFHQSLVKTESTTWNELIPCLDFLLVSLNSRGNASLHRSWQSNACLLIQTPLIPTEQTLPNYKQCQTHSYPAVSTSQSHREHHSLADSVETDSVCTQISHLPCALCPWPRCVCPAEVGETWQEVLIYSHFEIKRERHWH